MLYKEKELLNCKTKMRLVTQANIHREKEEEREHKRTEKTKANIHSEKEVESA